MTTAGDSNARTEIQVGFTLGREHAHTFSPLKTHFGAIVGGENGCNHLI